MKDRKVGVFARDFAPLLARENDLPTRLRR